MEALLTTDALISLFTLTLLEVVLGIDNIIFITIVAAKLPKSLEKKAQNYGLGIALILRIILLFGISWVISLKEPLFEILGHGFSGRDLILLGGGLFLIYSATREIHQKLQGDTKHLEGADEAEADPKKKGGITFGRALTEMAILNVIFSFDSVLTAVGLTDIVIVMIVAVVLSTVIMIIFANRIGNFVNDRPSIKILALSFLIMIGTLLIAESFHYELPKGYAYFAMAFSLAVELLNLRYDKKVAPVKLHDRIG